MKTEAPTAEVLSIEKNIMGTIDVNMKLKGMRKPQSFIIYPIKKETKYLKLQSSTRMAKVDLNGNGEVTRPHSNGAYFIHLQTDKLTPFKFSKTDWRQIVEYIGLTESSEAGRKENGIVFSDNSGARSIFGLD